MHKKIIRISTILIFSILFYCQNSFSFSIVRNPGNKNENKVEIKNPDYLKASFFVNMSAKQFENATGQKLNLFQKVYFKIIQHQLKRDLKRNPNLLITNYVDVKTAKFKFSFLWFVIASFIGPFGVLLAYYAHPQKKDPVTKKDKIKSAWLGFVFFVLWFGILFIFP